MSNVLLSSAQRAAFIIHQLRRHTVERCRRKSSFVVRVTNNWSVSGAGAKLAEKTQSTAAPIPLNFSVAPVRQHYALPGATTWG